MSREWQRIPKGKRDDEPMKRLLRCLDLFDAIEPHDAFRTELVRAAQVEPGALREAALRHLAERVGRP